MLVFIDAHHKIKARPSSARKVMALVNQSEIWQKYLLWFKLVGVLVWLC